MREVWAGSTPTGGSRRFALGLLLDGRIASKTPIPPPPGARYAHKTGELGGVENDAGIFFLPGRSFALAVLVEGDVGRAAVPLSEALRVLCGFSMPARMGLRQMGFALAGCMNIPRFCMQGMSGSVVSMHMRLDNVSVARLQCR